MKKILFTCGLVLASIVAFSQQAVVKDGKAVETIPQKEVQLSKEQTLMKKQELQEQVDMLQLQIATLNNQLAEVKARLENYKDVCNKLGYK